MSSANPLTHHMYNHREQQNLISALKLSVCSLLWHTRAYRQYLWNQPSRIEAPQISSQYKSRYHLKGPIKLFHYFGGNHKLKLSREQQLASALAW